MRAITVRLFAILILILSLSAGAFGASTDTLLAFHVPDRDFKPIEPPDWILGSPLAAITVNDGEIDQAAQLGVTWVIPVQIETKLYYPLLKDDPKSGMPADKIAKAKVTIAKAREHGMHVVIGGQFAPAQMVKAHLDWLSRAVDNDDIEKKVAAADLAKGENYMMLLGFCMNSPWGDYYIENMAEILKTLGADGYNFDGNYHPAVCYCKYCKEGYKKATGRDIPKKVDVNDLDYRVYLLWADDQLENWYRKLHDRLRQVNPEAAIATWSVNAGRYGHFMTSPRAMSQRMNLIIDCPMQEWWLDETNFGASIIPPFGAAFIRAVTANRMGMCQPYYMSHGNPYGDDGLPGHEIIVRSAQAFTNGGAIEEFMGYGTRATENLKFLQQRAPWLVRAKQMPWAAMLFSEQTRQFYGGDQILDRCMAHALGVFRVAAEEHRALTLITDWEIRPERLAPYKLLILPNTACLSDDQIRVIKEYVSNGGGLLASCDTSLFDEIGRPRHDFALSELFGVNYLGRPKASEARPQLDINFAITVDEKYWAQRTGIAALRWGDADLGDHGIIDDARLNELIPNRQVTFKGPQVKVSEPKAPIVRGMMMFPDSGSEAMPAIVMGQYGKGRVVYMAAGIDAGYFNYWYPYQRRLLDKAICWAAGQPFPVQVEAPMCIQSTFWEQSDKAGKRIVVQLFNGLDTIANHGRPENAVPLREESIPISGIRLRFTGLNVKSFHFEPGGLKMVPKTEGDATVIEIPPILIHGLLVAEL